MEIRKWAKKQILDLLNNESSNEVKQDYLRKIKGLGNMIIQNGLFGAIAFHKVKKEKKGNAGSKKIISQIQDFGECFLRIKDITDFPKLDNHDFLKSQRLFLEAVGWLRRFAEIYLGDDEDD